MRSTYLSSYIFIYLPESRDTVISTSKQVDKVMPDYLLCTTFCANLKRQRELIKQVFFLPPDLKRLVT